MFNRYFEKFLSVAPVALALWRAKEAEVVSSHPLTPPCLDIGCGFGEFMGVFAPGEIDMGIDISSRDLAIAKSRQVYKQVQRADARKLPFKNASYQTIVSISVLEHIPRVERVFHEAYRVLKPGGTFIFTVPTNLLNESLLGARFKFYRAWFDSMFKHQPLKTKQRWLTMATNAGFSIIECQPTISRKQLHAFELGIPTAAVSQIGRLVTGERWVQWLPLKTKLCMAVTNATLKGKEAAADINIMIVCQKK